MSAAEKLEEKSLIKLDLGCGTRKRGDGYLGVDCRDFPGVDLVADLTKPWPWSDASVEAAHCSHFVEHLVPAERIHFVNELWRVLIPGGQCVMITPHWCSHRAYGDLTHVWPPVSEMWFSYLDKDWRAREAPHNDRYTCDFTTTWGYGFHSSLNGRNPEYVTYALNWYKEAAQDLHATLTARKP